MDAPVPLIACALLAAGTLLLRSPRLRALSTLGALVLAPVLLVGDIWDTDQVQTLRAHPPVAVAGAAAGVAAVLVLAWLFHRRPTAFPVAAALTIPFRVPIAVGSTTSNLLVPLYLVIAAGALAYALPRLRREEDDRRAPERRPGAVEWLLAATVVLYAVQASYSGDRDQALQNLVFFYVPFAILFALLARVAWTRRLALQVLAALAALAVVFVAVGFVEYATRHLLMNPKVIAANQSGSAFRVNSLFFDPNMYGRFLAVVMLGLATVLLWARRGREVALLGALLALLWAGLVLTLSQTSFAALLLGLLVLAGARWRPRWAVGVAAVAVAAAVAIVVLAPSALQLDLGSAKGANSATSGRYDLVSGGVDLFRERPVQGFGSGGFSRAYRAHHGWQGVAVAASHTIPVTVAAEQGIIGLALYAALLIAAFATLLRGVRTSAVRVAIAAAFAALVLHTWSYAAFLEDPTAWALLGAGLALAVAAAQRRPRRRREQRAAVPAAV